MASSSSQLKKQVNVLVSGDFMLKESFYRDKIGVDACILWSPRRGEARSILPEPQANYANGRRLNYGGRRN
ncbi:unnamed protein product [Arabis nemorensis]|uniref:Uncharacterized protein n=1 Tax=Arabis nemorensis TaxID=586526 RepID=A0A565B614_9BRAS|nr:unnamed protein product [Arabis nemorensis]